MTPAELALVAKRQRERERYYANREARIRQACEWSKKNPHKTREYNRRSREKNRYKIEVRRRKKAYGITPLELLALLRACDRRCSICQQHFADVGFCVDHCHKTGRVRGLLCRKCNSAIGLLRDDPDLLLRALEYLRR